MQDIALPVRLGPTTLMARIGAGGMGVVYYGLLGPTPVAVKVIRDDLAGTPEFRARFRREIELMRRVRGLCTARVYDANPDWSPPYLATEFLAGPTLADWMLRNGVLADAALRTLAIGLAEALLAVHRAGVVHRDLKPGNVLLTQAGPKVVDFGIAHASDVTALTRVGTPVGTPGYMSPEQLTGLEVVGPAADIFAWGCTVAYAATGRIPFGEGPTDAVLFRVRHDPPNLVGVPDELAGLIAATLDKDPARRPDAAELLRRLLPMALGDGWVADAAGEEPAVPPVDGAAPAPTEVALIRAVAVALDRQWPIRAYLPPPPSSAPPAQPRPPLAAQHPNQPPGAAPRPQQGPPAVGPAGVPPRPAVPMVWPAPQWAPPVGRPVGPLPMLGRPAAPMPAAGPAAGAPPPGPRVLAGRPGTSAPPPAPPGPRGAPLPGGGALPPRSPGGGPGPVMPPGLVHLPGETPATGRRGFAGVGTLTVVVLALLLVLVLAAVSVLVYRGTRGGPSSRPPAGPSAAATPGVGVGTPKAGASPQTSGVASSTAGYCVYTSVPAAGRAVPLPPSRADVSRQPADMVIATDHGQIEIQLDAADAPCAVYALRQLATTGYYNGTVCPPMEAGSGAQVSLLRCGVPADGGSSTPPFQYAAERTGSGFLDAGTVAMVPAGDGSNGAQFVICYDSTAPGLTVMSGQYTVIGQVTDGLATVNWLANNSATDAGQSSKPSFQAEIESVTVTQ